MRGTMELEIPVKLIIALIVVTVVISFVFLVYRNIVSRINKHPQEHDVLTIAKAKFTMADIDRISSMCYQKARDRPGYSITCYVMKGDMSGLQPSDSISCNDLSKGFLIVRYLPSRGVVFDC